MSNWLRRVFFKCCRGCGDEMRGVWSYAVRDMCEECGGEPKATGKAYRLQPLPNSKTD